MAMVIGNNMGIGNSSWNNASKTSGYKTVRVHVFKTSLENDFKDVVELYCKYYNMDKRDAYAEISKSLKGDKLKAIRQTFPNLYKIYEDMLRI